MYGHMNKHQLWSGDRGLWGNHSLYYYGGRKLLGGDTLYWVGS